MPVQMQEGFGCAITNRFDQLFDDESDPFELLKQAEVKKKKEPAVPGAAKTVAQAAKPPKKESQKERKIPLADKKEETQAAVPLKKEGNLISTPSEWRHPNRTDIEANKPASSFQTRGPCF